MHTAKIVQSSATPLEGVSRQCIAGICAMFFIAINCNEDKIDLIDCFHGYKLHLEETSVLGFVCVGIYEWVCNIELYLKKSIDWIWCEKPPVLVACESAECQESEAEWKSLRWFTEKIYYRLKPCTANPFCGFAKLIRARLCSGGRNHIDGLHYIIRIPTPRWNLFSVCF